MSPSFRCSGPLPLWRQISSVFGLMPSNAAVCSLSSNSSESFTCRFPARMTRGEPRAVMGCPAAAQVPEPVGCSSFMLLAAAPARPFCTWIENSCRALSRRCGNASPMQPISRSEAKARGLKRYFSGKPCKRGHVAERFTLSYQCVECNRESGRAWEKANPETVRAEARERERRWRKANPDEAKEKSRVAHERRMAVLREQTLEAERVTGLRGMKARQAYIERFGAFPEQQRSSG